MKYLCTICGYIYDEEKEGTKFEDLPSDWTCPLCAAPKDDFEVQEQPDEKKFCVKISLKTGKYFLSVVLYKPWKALQTDIRIFNSALIIRKTRMIILTGVPILNLQMI